MNRMMIVFPAFLAIAAMLLSCGIMGGDRAPDTAAMTAQVQSLLYSQERAADAHALATKALDADPAGAMLRYHRGMASMALKQDTDALNDFSVAMKLDPQNPMVYNGLGNIFYLKYQDAIAERYWSRGLALAKDPATKALFLGNMSLISSSKKKYPEAVRLLNEAIALAKDGRYYNLLGRIYIAQKEVKKARETWTKAVSDPAISFSQASFRHNTLYRLAELLADQKEFHEALKFCGMALDLSPATGEYQKLYVKLSGLAK
ncbi:MAG TPA: tetratricopeptide repeat protein [Spirochaetota bacterium]|nr:tetratricopeptide repeat protein [Spirochaetota bacterium]